MEDSSEDDDDDDDSEEETDDSEEEDEETPNKVNFSYYQHNTFTFSVGDVKPLPSCLYHLP